MYITVVELAEYLGLTPQYIMTQIQHGHVKAVFDGENYMINREQFNWHKEQLDNVRKQLAEEEDGLPEDWDAKDED